MHFCLGVGPLIVSFMFGVLLKGYLYVMVCIGVGALIASFMFGVLLIENKGYVYLSDHTQYMSTFLLLVVFMCSWSIGNSIGKP